MKAHRAAIVLAALLTSACRCEEAPPADAFLGVVERRFVRLGGRPFSFTVIQPESPAGAPPSGRVLSIAGDDRYVSFHVSGSPGAPSTSESAVEFGGHSFAVTATPGEYVIDGRAISLAPHGRSVHVFSDGAYHGAQPF